MENKEFKNNAAELDDDTLDNISGGVARTIHSDILVDNTEDDPSNDSNVLSGPILR